MKFKEWLKSVIDSGNLCSGYKDKAMESKSKSALMDIVLDANGVSYLCEMDSRGYALPYETILNEFKSYINGRYVYTRKNDKGNGYSSSIYCCYCDSDSININTTLTTLLGCKSSIVVGGCDFVRLYADKNCELKVYCPITSRCIIEYWDGAIVDVCTNYDNVELIKH